MKALCWLGILLFASQSFANELNSRILIRGKVFSKTDQKPLPYVNIFPEESNYGTFTNLDGAFELLVRKEDYNKKLVASMIGFEQEAIPMDTARTYQIFLREKPQELSEVVISDYTAEQLLDNFRLRVHDNYPNMPMVHRVFLREYEKIRGGGNIYLNEVMVDYLRNGYLDPDDDLMKLVKGRNKVYDESIPFDYMSGGFGDIHGDLIKYPKDFLLKSKGYEFDVVNIYPGERKTFKISFKVKGKGEYEGFLYIEDVSFALLKAEVSYTEYALGILNKLTKNVGFSWDDLKETVVYRKGAKGKYYLSEVISEGIGYDIHIATPLVINSELLVIETDVATFFANEFEPIEKQIAISEINFKDTPFFWEENNYLVMEESFAYE